MDEALQERIGFNEAAFRRVNEGIRSAQGGLIGFRCECARLGCTRIIELTREEYEAVRADPRQFAIEEGHEVPEAEEVVLRTERYAVVRKLDRGADVAEELDPRDRP